MVQLYRLDTGSGGKAFLLRKECGNENTVYRMVELWK